METKNALVVFQDKQIRRIRHNDEWYFSVIDIVEVLTDSPTPRQYWGKTKDREFKQLELSPIWVQLKLKATDGKKYATDCVNTENAFRLIQSIPSKRAEPFKRWLAKVGYERVQEIENPELAQERMKEIYLAKGYPKEWIDKRLRGIAIRQDLTDEWKERGIEKQKDFAILTAEISKATFGMTPSEYKQYKNLPKQSKANLRDHMDDLELIFTMLGERMTTRISEKEKPDSLTKSKDVAKRGGEVAGDAKKRAEKELGEPVTTKQNFLSKSKKKKELQDKSKK